MLNRTKQSQTTYLRKWSFSKPLPCNASVQSYLGNCNYTHLISLHGGTPVRTIRNSLSPVSWASSWLTAPYSSYPGHAKTQLVCGFKGYISKKKKVQFNYKYDGRIRYSLLLSQLFIREVAIFDFEVGVDEVRLTFGRGGLLLKVPAGNSELKTSDSKWNAP